MDLLIAIPVYGQHHYTHALVSDLWRDNADYVIIDNRGDYPPLRDEQVITPGKNLAWTGGSQLGFTYGFERGYDAVMTLNNDTRLSPGFADAFTDTRLPANAGIIGPLIDHGFPSAETDPIPAAEFTPAHRYREVAAVEGVAMAVTRRCFEHIGGLDVRSFGQYGWGADLDLCLRASMAGFGLYITEMAYINHFGQATAHTFADHDTWQAWASGEMVAGMRKRYGHNWTARFPPCSWRHDGQQPFYMLREFEDQHA